MVPVQSKAREKTYAPFLTFAFTAGIAVPFRGAPTLFMDATIDTRFLAKLFPNIVTSEYAACPKDPHARIVQVNEGYGKSSTMTRPATPSRKTEGLWLLFRGLQMAFGDRGAGFITHKEVVLAGRTEEDVDDPLIGWHGNIRGVDAWSGFAALLVAGSSTPPPKEAEIATEALLGRVVDRDPVTEGSPWSVGVRPDGRSSTAAPLDRELASRPGCRRLHSSGGHGRDRAGGGSRQVRAEPRPADRRRSRPRSPPARIGASWNGARWSRTTSTAC